MRSKKDNTRRVGGLLLDLLMLSFIISFSLADVKITNGYVEDSVLIIRPAPNNVTIVRDFDTVFSTLLKNAPKFQPDNSQSLGVIFDLSPVKDAMRVVLITMPYFHKNIYANTTINAP
ncbi:MAG TPA: hypothetical protein VK666_23740 [Chryseolinea sp.]|nr:hypothetical protein [Chryseolinea sp.]